MNFWGIFLLAVPGQMLLSAWATRLGSMGSQGRLGQGNSPRGRGDPAPLPTCKAFTPKFLPPSISPAPKQAPSP